MCIHILANALHVTDDMYTRSTVTLTHRHKYTLYSAKCLSWGLCGIFEKREIEIIPRRWLWPALALRQATVTTQIIADEQTQFGVAKWVLVNDPADGGQQRDSKSKERRNVLKSSATNRKSNVEVNTTTIAIYTRLEIKCSMSYWHWQV